MVVFLLLASFIVLIPNLLTINDYSNTSIFVLILEHSFTLYAAYLIIWNNFLDQDIRIKIKFYSFFLISYILSLICLYTCWTPFLDSDSEGWGFDPQRYYYYASNIITDNNIEFGLNYVGVVYFYSFIMSIFGINPLIPLFFNVIFVLYTCIVITKFFINIQNIDIKYFSWLLLVPEIIVFNVMSSREILVMCSLTIFVIKVFSLKDKKYKDFLITFLSLFFAGFIRPPMAMMGILSVFLWHFMTSKLKNNIVLIFVAVCSFLIIFYTGDLLGSLSDNASLIEAASQKIQGDNEIGEAFSYTDNSFTKKLIPHNLVEFFVFGFIRSICYLLPDPSFFQVIDSFFNISNYVIYVNWNTVCMFFSITILWGLFLRRGSLDKRIQYLLFNLLFCLFFIGTLNTNLIHQRYRIVYDLLYFSLVIYGYSQRVQKSKLSV